MREGFSRLAESLDGVAEGVAKVEDMSYAFIAWVLFYHGQFYLGTGSNHFGSDVQIAIQYGLAELMVMRRTANHEGFEHLKGAIEECFIG